MAEYIERTEELILAVNAGARAIEQSKRLHGVTYCMDVFSNNPKEIPYVIAANVLREFDEIPAADVVEVVRCKDCKYQGKAIRLFAGENPIDVSACIEGRIPYCKENDFCSYGEKRGDDNAVD